MTRLILSATVQEMTQTPTPFARNPNVLKTPSVAAHVPYPNLRHHPCRLIARETANAWQATFVRQVQPGSTEAGILAEDRMDNRSCAEEEALAKAHGRMVEGLQDRDREGRDVACPCIDGHRLGLDWLCR